MGAASGSRAVTGKKWVGRAGSWRPRGGKAEQFIIYRYKARETRSGDEAPSGRESGSVGDDELVYPPVFIAPVGQVAPNDDGDLPGPVAGRRHKYMRAGGQAVCRTQGKRSLRRIRLGP